MLHVKLNDFEVTRIDELLAELASRHTQSGVDSLLHEAAVWAQELPRTLRSQINDFRLREPDDGVILISGVPVDDSRISPTPESLDQLPKPSPTYREELFLVLVSVLLGDLIAWSTQQSGRIIHDVFPIQSHQDMQLGTGCRQLLTWHTEDAFHPFRSDYLAMMCLRNPQQVPTTIASIASIEIDDETRQILFEPRFTIRPDESHRGITDIQPVNDQARAAISDQIESSLAGPVMFGNPDHPYWCLDPYFMPKPKDNAARRALEILVEQIDDKIVDVVLEPGDVCIMDNYRVVHGRRPFQARFDGTDRWLKRVLVVRDLRKSVTARKDVASRVIE